MTSRGTVDRVREQYIVFSIARCSSGGMGSCTSKTTCTSKPASQMSRIASSIWYVYMICSTQAQTHAT
jgi:hypothetical protein